MMKTLLKALLKDVKADYPRAQEAGLIDDYGEVTEGGDLFTTQLDIDSEVKKINKMVNEINRHVDETDDAVFMYTVGKFCGLTDKDIDEGLEAGCGKQEILAMATKIVEAKGSALTMLRAAGVNNTPQGILIKDAMLKLAMGVL